MAALIAGAYCTAGGRKCLLNILSVQGRMSIPFKEIERHKRVKDNYSLHGVRRGQLTVSCSWMGISQSE